MSRQPGQVLMFNDAELALIKSTFSDNDDLLFAIRNVLLQFDLSKADKALLKASITPEVYDVVRKRVFPEIHQDAPFFQLSDLYQTLTPDMSAKSVEQMAPLFDSKQLQIDYLEQQFAVLKDVDAKVKTGDRIDLDSLKDLHDKDDRTRYVHSSARNYILGHIDTFLNHLRQLAGQRNETIEEAKARLTRNSSK